MKYFLRHNTFILYISVIFFINIASITMQKTTIEVEGLDTLVSSSLDRVLEAIDPTIEKIQNGTIEILSIIEDRIKINVSETLYRLETNLFVLLFAIIIFFVFVFIFLNLLDVLLERYAYTAETRRFFGLAIMTIIFVWLLIAMILSTWPLENKFDVQILKYVLVALLAIVVLYFVIIWIYYLYKTLKDRREGKNILLRGRPFQNEDEILELDNMRL